MNASRIVPGARIAPEDFNKRLRFVAHRKEGGAAELMFFRGPSDAGQSVSLSPVEAAALRDALETTGFSVHLREEATPDPQLAFAGEGWR
jgi:hypothetical protein